MKTEDAYNKWAGTYDHVENKTRDLESLALRSILGNETFDHVLELGCGTGKNTAFLAGISKTVTAVDFSEEMMAIAKQKHPLPNIVFQQADITQQWHFKAADLVTCSLVLEHIQELAPVFQNAYNTLFSNGKFYICELHPYKQMQGSRAKFESDGQLVQLEFFVHHLSDFFQSAKKYGFQCTDMQEWFDGNDHTQTPRLCSFLFEKI